MFLNNVSLKAYKTKVRTHNSFRELRPLKIHSGSEESLLKLRSLNPKKKEYLEQKSVINLHRHG